MSQDLQNDWLVHMFWSVCISMSDQSPSTKRCNKQDCRNQVVQFLTNPFLANFQNGHSPPLHIGMERLVVTQKGGPHVPPIYGETHGVIYGQSYKSKRGGGLAACHQSWRMTGKCLCFGVCAYLCQISPLVQRGAINNIWETRLCNFWLTPF